MAMIALDTSNQWTRYALYKVNNRKHDGQVVLVWKNPSPEGQRYGFTFHDDEKGHRFESWELLGELNIQIKNNEFVYKITPLQERDAVDLAMRAHQTELHKAYRARLYRQFPLEERLKRLRGEV
jgi:hypothetical protein